MLPVIPHAEIQTKATHILNRKPSNAGLWVKPAYCRAKAQGRGQRRRRRSKEKGGSGKGRKGAGKENTHSSTLDNPLAFISREDLLNCTVGTDLVCSQCSI